MSESWADPGERRRWEAALGDVADRLHEERGVDDPWGLTVEFGALWANYGEFRSEWPGRTRSR